MRIINDKLIIEETRWRKGDDETDPYLKRDNIGAVCDYNKASNEVEIMIHDRHYITFNVSEFLEKLKLHGFNPELLKDMLDENGTA